LRSDEDWAFRDSDDTYYYNGTEPNNHAVTIVGWDGAKATPAASPGAWLIKNSWGTGFGDQGYFWVSYSDTEAARYGASFHDAVPATTFSRVYSYDTFGDVAECNNPYAFNAFTAAASEPLKAVEFWTQADWANYDVRVYDTFSGGRLSNLLASTSGTISYAGSHTVDLPTPIPLTAGNSFYVYVGITNGGNYPQAIDYRRMGYCSASTANPGESYYSFDGTSWNDLTNFEPTANFCIKALTASPPPMPALSIHDIMYFEGNSGVTGATFAVSLSTPSYQTITVGWSTTDGTAKSGSDYLASSGTLTFLRGQSTATLSVPIRGDRTPEPDKTFLVSLSNPSNASIARGQGIGMICNDDTRITINDVRITEGNSETRNAVFTVRLSGAGNFPVTVNYATADGTAKAGSDYLARVGTLAFGRRQTSKTIAIPIIGDRLVEPNETFSVRLSGATCAIIADGEGKGTILNNDRGGNRRAVTTPMLAALPVAGAPGPPVVPVPDSPFLITILNADVSGNEGHDSVTPWQQQLTAPRRRVSLWKR
jgi:hypothetical protein